MEHVIPREDYGLIGKYWVPNTIYKDGEFQELLYKNVGEQISLSECLDTVRSIVSQDKELTTATWYYDYKGRKCMFVPRFNNEEDSYKTNSRVGVIGGLVEKIIMPLPQKKEDASIDLQVNAVEDPNIVDIITEGLGTTSNIVSQNIDDAVVNLSNNDPTLPVTSILWLLLIIAFIYLLFRLL